MEFVDLNYVLSSHVSSSPSALAMKKYFNNHGGEYVMSINRTEAEKEGEAPEIV